MTDYNKELCSFNDLQEKIVTWIKDEHGEEWMEKEIKKCNECQNAEDLAQFIDELIDTNPRDAMAWLIDVITNHERAPI